MAEGVPTAPTPSLSLASITPTLPSLCLLILAHTSGKNSYPTTGHASDPEPKIILPPSHPHLHSITPNTSPCLHHVRGQASILNSSLLFHQKLEQHPEPQRPGQFPKNQEYASYCTRSQASILNNREPAAMSETTHISKTPVHSLGANPNWMRDHPDQFKWSTAGHYSQKTRKERWKKEENTHPTKTTPEIDTPRPLITPVFFLVYGRIVSQRLGLHRAELLPINNYLKMPYAFGKYED